MITNQLEPTNIGGIATAIRPAASGQPTVVFLSGVGQFSTGETFAPIIAQLPDTVGICAIDYIACGHSQLAIRDYTAADQTAAIAQIIMEAHAGSIILVAHSIGGIYALLLTELIPNIRGIVGIEPTTQEIMFNPPTTAEYQQAAKMEEAWTAAQMEAYLKQHSAAEFSPEQDRRIWATCARSMSQLTTLENQRISKCIQSMPWDDSTLHMPTNFPCVLITESYRAAEMRRSEYMNAHPLSAVVTAGSYHYVHWERPDVVADTIRKLL